MNAHSEKPQFREGDEVYDAARKYGLGRIVGEPRRIGGAWWYRVRFEGGRTEQLAEKHLIRAAAEAEGLESIVLGGRFGALSAFQRAIAVARLRKDSENRSTFYSFNAQRVQFQAYQYRPLLRFLDSEDRKLLIADEVGLGKTIEAGLILAELEARQDLDRVLVVCPSRLREKWQEELNRKFGQNFEIWSAKSVWDYLRRVRQNPRLTRMRAIVSLQALRNADVYLPLIEAAATFDLLILDESHYVRNRATSSYKAIEEIANASDAMLFLSATPIHLKNEDLFNQLRLLRPAEYRQAEVFDLVSRSNHGVVMALARIRTRDPGELAAAASDVERSFEHSHQANEHLAVVQEIVARLRTARPHALRDWFDLERDVERLHHLNGIVTRTRKREVLAFRSVRLPDVVPVTWTPIENALYQRLTGLDGAKSWPTSRCPFGTAQRQRLAASSLLGTLLFRDNVAGLNDHRADGFDESDDDIETALAELSTVASPSSVTDSKLEKLLELLIGIEAAAPGSKVLIFTTFVSTSRYLTESLNQRGIKTIRIAGDVPSTPSNPQADERGRRLRDFRDDPSVRVMVSTEVGSEGLDFQFCSRLVNYDLPWNPMTVEQRIGRIDRFGQKDQTLKIWSLVVEGTIEERILARLYARIGIFERSIGPLEAILGEKMAELRREFFDGKLTPEQAADREEQAASAIERAKRDTEDLEQEADRLFGHEEFIRAECERVQNFGRYVTPSALLAVVRGYLSTTQPDIEPVEEGEGVWSVRFTERWQQSLLSDSNVSQAGLARMRPFVRRGRYHFALEGAKAYDRQDVDLLNASHPLILAAQTRLEELHSDPANRTGVARLVVSPNSEPFRAGTYLVAAYRMHVTGARARTTIETCGASVIDDSRIEAEAAERLLHLVLTRGEDAPGLRTERRVSAACWRLATDEMHLRSSAIEERESEESRLVNARRVARIEAEYDYRMRVIESAEQTAKERGNWERVQRMQAGQRDAAKSRLQKAKEETERMARVQTSFSPEPIAVCLVEVVER
jgi:ATP-dependent helicase HepA